MPRQLGHQRREPHLPVTNERPKQTAAGPRYAGAHLLDQRLGEPAQLRRIAHGPYRSGSFSPTRGRGLAGASTLAPMLIRAKAPLRISFRGGRPDVPPFPEREGGLVLNATINRYAYGTLRQRSDRAITIHSYDYGSRIELAPDESPVFDGKLDWPRRLLARFTEGSRTGFDLLLHSNAPPGSGLGASSAMMVALVGVPG